MPVMSMCFDKNGKLCRDFIVVANSGGKEGGIK